MFQTKTILTFSFCALFMHPHVELKSTSTTKNGNLSITNSKTLTKRAVSTISESDLWKDAIIPFEMESNLEPHRCLIESAMMHIMLQSCILFRPAQDQKQRMGPTLSIEKPNAEKCAATMGTTTWLNGRSVFFLNNNRCFTFGAILHELMHVLGFDHEHLRSDRDQYLQIKYDNLKNDALIRQYEKNDRSSENNLTQFDIDSITIYGPMDGSKDRTRLKTIESKVPGKKIVAPEDKLSLSPLDVKSINALYKCPLLDNNACEKFALLNDYIANCIAEARKYIKLSWIKRLIDQCR